MVNLQCTVEFSDTSTLTLYCTVLVFVRWIEANSRLMSKCMSDGGGGGGVVVDMLCNSNKKKKTRLKQNIQCVRAVVV